MVDRWREVNPSRNDGFPGRTAPLHTCGNPNHHVATYQHMNATFITQPKGHKEQYAPPCNGRLNALFNYNRLL
jgi:hypothetical protein